MKIAVLGWYGHNNAGDERIKYCLHHFLFALGGITHVNFYNLHDQAIKGKTNKFDDYDLVIIGGGGLILSQCNYHDFIYGINTKMVALGISVERPRLMNNAKKFSMALLDKCLAVLVRDQDSANKLFPYDHRKIVKQSYDLTFLLPYQTVNCSNDKIMGINLLPKAVDYKYSTLNIRGVSFLSRVLAQVGVNDVIRVTDFNSLLRELKNQYQLLPIPLYCAPQQSNIPRYQKNDIEFLKQYFDNVPLQFSDTAMDECSLLLSMRLHAAIFAVQKGIPVLSFPYLPKNRNFMREVGLEEFVLETIENKNVCAVIDSLEKKKPIIRDIMSAYKEKATMQIHQDIIAILNLVK